MTMPIVQPILLATVSAPLIGVISPVPMVVDPLADTIVFAWDISNHAAGNSAVMVMSADVSLDGGATWEFLISGARDKGYDPIFDKHGVLQTMASVTSPLPGVGVIGRQVRCSLTSSSSVTTLVIVTQSASG